MSTPPDHEILDWVATFVTRINSLDPEHGETIELLAADGDRLVLVTRSGPDAPAALRKCVSAAMEQFPPVNSASSARCKKN